MAIKQNIEIQDHEGNIYYPHSDAKTTFLEDGSNVEVNISKLKNTNATRDLISVNTSTISSNSSTFMFSVKEDKNMQSLCYHDNYVYVGFALEDNNSLIIKYDMSGKEIARSGTLPLEHCSSMVFNNNNNK